LEETLHERSCEDVQKRIHEALAKFEGRPWNDETRAKMVKCISTSLRDLFPGPEVDDALYELIALSFMGTLPPAAELKALVKRLRDDTLEQEARRVNPNVFPGALIYIEYMFRNDRLTCDWEVKVDGTNVDLSFMTKAPVEQLAVTSSDEDGPEH
jgi:hypothetical protein